MNWRPRVLSFNLSRMRAGTEHPALSGATGPFAQQTVLVPLALLILALSLLVVSCAGQSTSRASATVQSESYSSDVLKGAWLFVEYACVQCHGIGGRGGSALRASGPSLISSEFKKAFPKGASYDSALINVIRNGTIVENDRAASMPAWNGILSEEEMRGIVAYIRAGLPDVGVPLPRAETGAEIYRAFACVKCHGPLGAGGIRNIAATDPVHQVIPPLGGAAFKQKLGSKEQVRKKMISGVFVEDGRTGVLYAPAWGRIGTAEQVDRVIDHIWEYEGP